MNDSSFSGEIDGLLLSLQVYVQKGDLSAVEQELSALHRLAVALKRRHAAVLEENEQLKSRLRSLVRRSRSVQTSLEANIEAHRAGLETFRRFKRNIEIVQKMRSLRELPGILNELKTSLQVDAICLLLRQEDFAGFAPSGNRLMPSRYLQELSEQLQPMFGDRSYYIGPWNIDNGPASLLPHDMRSATGAFQTGSCFFYQLTDKYDPQGLLGFILLLDADPERYASYKAADFLEHFCSMFGSTLVSVLEHEKLDRENVVDGLTGAYNREYLRRHARRMMDFAGRKGLPVSLAYMDLDGFKAVNDILGHKTGDELLKGIVRAVKGMIRRYDIFVRLGGDEFVVLLPGTGIQSAQAFKERLVQSVESVSIAECSGQAADLLVSASVGVAEWSRDQSLDDLLREADSAMYREKRAGKGRAGKRDSGDV